MPEPIEKEDKKEIPARAETLDDVVARGDAELEAKEEEKKEEEEKDKTPEVDPMETVRESINALGEEIKGISDRVSAMTPAEKKEEEEADEDDPNGEKYKPKSWKENIEKMEETAEQVLDRKEKERSDAEKAHKDELKAIDEEFSAQEAILKEANILPDVKDAENPDDPGRAFRREMYGWASKLETLKIEKVGRDLAKMHESGLRYDVKTDQFIRKTVQPMGHDSPIGSSSARGSSNEGKPTYKDIHRMNMDEMVRRSAE